MPTKGAPNAVLRKNKNKMATEKRRFRHSLVFKYTLFMLFALSSLMFVEAVFAQRTHQRLLEADFDKDASAILETTSMSMSFALWDFDVEILQAMSDALVVHPYIVSTSVIEPSGQMIVETNLRKAEASDLETRKAPIYSPTGETIGTLSITFSLAHLETAMQAQWIAFVGRNLFVCLLVFVTMMWTIPALIRPIKRLQVAVKSYDGRERMESAPGDDRNDEIGSLARGVRDMAAQIHDNVLTLETRVETRTRELSEAVRQADLANEAKSAFLANMSHEIRTPMNGILGMAQILKKGDLSAKQKGFVDIIYESGFALVTIINDILDYSKIEAGKVELEQEPFHLGRTIGDVASLLGVTARDKGLELMIRIRPDVPRTLIGDAGRLRQVVTNLVGNAVKFTENGFVLIDVKARSDETTAHLEIAIRDTGIGIKEDKLATIFDEFTQAEQSTTRQYGGTGLGLSITKSIVETMGGHMSVSSVYGEGSVFQVDLSLPIADKKIALRSDKADIQFNGERVLSIDDNATNQKIIKENLASWGLQPVLAMSAKEGLACLKSSIETGETISLILTDFNMPTHNGLHFVNALRRFPPVADLPVIVLSSANDDGLTARFNERGVKHILTKPLRFPVLKLAIHDTIRSHKAAKTSVISQTATVVAPPKTVSAQDDALRPPETKRRGPHALIADDNQINRDVLNFMLKDRGFEIDEAENGQVAYQKARICDYDVIFMDISMPVMDGITAMKSIRKFQISEGRPQKPIIAVTAHAMIKDRDNMMRAGMSDYLAKPFDMGTLDEILGKWDLSPVAATLKAAS